MYARSGVFIVKFGQISCIAPVFHCLFSTSKCQLKKTHCTKNKAFHRGSL